MSDEDQPPGSPAGHASPEKGLNGRVPGGLSRRGSRLLILGGGLAAIVLVWTVGWAARDAGFPRAAYEALAKAHAAGQLTDVGGVVKLPANQAASTIDGRMYVTPGGSSGNLYLFITWQGKGSNLRGYLYHHGHTASSRPAEGGSMVIQAPAIYAPSGRGPVEVEFEPMSAPGWYRVSRSLD